MKNTLQAVEAHSMTCYLAVHLGGFDSRTRHESKPILSIMATLTTSEYAELSGITQRAVQKSVKKCVDQHREEKKIPPDKQVTVTKIDNKALVAIEKIEFFGKTAQLVMEKDYKRKIAKSIPDRLKKVRSKVK
jgi:hypothetical protein